MNGVTGVVFIASSWTLRDMTKGRLEATRVIPATFRSGKKDLRDFEPDMRDARLRACAPAFHRAGKCDKRAG